MLTRMLGFEILEDRRLPMIRGTRNLAVHGRDLVRSSRR